MSNKETALTRNANHTAKKKKGSRSTASPADIERLLCGDGESDEESEAKRRRQISRRAERKKKKEERLKTNNRMTDPETTPPPASAENADATPTAAPAAASTTSAPDSSAPPPTDDVRGTQTEGHDVTSTPGPVVLLEEGVNKNLAGIPDSAVEQAKGLVRNTDERYVKF
jgi:hypothetical protein